MPVIEYPIDSPYFGVDGNQGIIEYKHRGGTVRVSKVRVRYFMIVIFISFIGGIIFITMYIFNSRFVFLSHKAHWWILLFWDINIVGIVRMLSYYSYP